MLRKFKALKTYQKVLIVLGIIAVIALVVLTIWKWDDIAAFITALLTGGVLEAEEAINEIKVNNKRKKLRKEVQHHIDPDKREVVNGRWVNVEVTIDADGNEHYRGKYHDTDNRLAGSTEECSSWKEMYDYLEREGYDPTNVQFDVY